MLLSCLALPGKTLGATWQVGPERTLKTPSEAARRARPGDVVEIDAGTYHNDYAVWQRDNITIRGLGAGVHLKSRGLIANGKAIWVVKGRNITIENIEFSGARVAHGNGAGIRQNGGSLLLRNTYFHDNEFAILTSNRDDAQLDIEDSRFANHRRQKGFAHAIYVGSSSRFSLTGSHVTATAGGHHVKSRAFENHILYNRLEDAPGIASSRLIDLSNCGLSYIVGNELLQRKDTHNINAIGYGPEKCGDSSREQKQLYVVNNTLLNESFNGVMVRNHATSEIVVGNNLLVGPGRFLSGGGSEIGNGRLERRQWQEKHWLPAAEAIAEVIDRSTVVRGSDGGPITADREFRPPAGTLDRPRHGAPDLGARELAP